MGRPAVRGRYGVEHQTRRVPDDRQVNFDNG
jgi:hypothetical protein